MDKTAGTEEIRLLLVDDEFAFINSLSKVFKNRGIVPETAGNGKECLSLLEQTPVDVVVLDVKMPGMNGIETLRHIKSKYPKTEVILLTGHANTQDGVEGIKSGAFDYLSKPIEIEHLFGKIRQAFEKIRLMEENQRQEELRAGIEKQMIVAERLASLGTMAVGVAHEINNPIAIIHEAADWMRLLLKRKELSNMPLKDEFEAVLGKIDRAVDRTKRITHQLLQSVKKQEPVFHEVNLRELVDESIDLVSAEATQRKISIVHETDRDPGSIWSDPHQLRQVLINLLTNALDATGADGKVTVRIESTDDKVGIEVADFGEGIPKENRDRIFEPFFTTKSPGKGTGLGLFVSRSMVEKLGGTIEFESRLGKGTVFRVIMPRFCEADGRLNEKKGTGSIEKQPVKERVG
jgi:two-component system NtrC family sensor kinase